MAADDLKPTRMEAAKAAARAFVQRQPATVQIGVVSFSEGGFAVQAPTNDQAAVLAAINRLALQRGTSLAPRHPGLAQRDRRRGHPPLTLREPHADAGADARRPCRKARYTSAVIVLLTDGENTEQPDPLAAAQTAADRGVRIYTVGIGSTAGATLHLDGFTVRSRLDEATLQQIAQITGGTYYNAENEDELHIDLR